MSATAGEQAREDWDCGSSSYTEETGEHRGTADIPAKEFDFLGWLPFSKSLVPYLVGGFQSVLELFNNVRASDDTAFFTDVDLFHI